MNAMTTAAQSGIEVWEGEGGATSATPSTTAVALTGTAAQIAWAERIRHLVDADFSRVASAFRAVAEKQAAAKRAETTSILAILEAIRCQVMSREQAGYFIHDWQDIGDQVRQLIFKDPLYQEIRTKRSIQ
jgi:hypothetical protein